VELVEYGELSVLFDYIECSGPLLVHLCQLVHWSVMPAKRCSLNAEWISGVVVQNFSYVFQTSDSNGITREEMRSFKKVWGEFADHKTGKLHPNNFGRFFSVCFPRPLCYPCRLTIHPAAYRNI
jgi:hypothetical protein